MKNLVWPQNASSGLQMPTLHTVLSLPQLALIHRSTLTSLTRLLPTKGLENLGCFKEGTLISPFTFAHKATKIAPCSFWTRATFHGLSLSESSLDCSNQIIAICFITFWQAAVNVQLCLVECNSCFCAKETQRIRLTNVFPRKPLQWPRVFCGNKRNTKNDVGWWQNPHSLVSLTPVGEQTFNFFQLLWPCIFSVPVAKLFVVFQMQFTPSTIARKQGKRTGPTGEA